MGEVDDVVVLLIALKMFLDLSPPNIVREHLDDLFGGRKGAGSAGDPPTEPYIDATYHILNEASDDASTENRR